ncbi:hypothetical protein [Leucobacter chromiireducens]|uniref:hypothetical protein n=1 Tax=Leucobacter chromiireducens TaxID=283877 RepID=UPI000F634EE6|nr:hypothetical protein [Leucobacter chromiireducens]
MIDVCVVGDGLVELAAALEFAEVGLSVRVVPAPGAEAGAGWQELLGDEGGALDPEGHLHEFLTHLAAPITPGDPAEQRATPRTVEPTPVLLRGAKQRWVPAPQPAVCGVPAVPMAADTMAVLGSAGAMRAVLDRVRPVLTIGKTHSFGELVRARMGEAALERLVEPLARETYGVHPNQIDAAIIAPGLNEAMTRVGTLSGAALDTVERSVARETRVLPDAGWAGLRDALRARLALYRVEFADAAPTRIREAEDGWLVETPADAEPGGEATAAGEFTARSIVVGIDARTAVDAIPELAELRVGHVRAAGELTIDDPGFPAELQGSAAVRTVTLQDGAEWSVRAVRGAAGWLARATGPAGEPERAAMPSVAARAREAVEAAGFVPRGAAHTLMPFAPYATVVSRDAAADRLDVWCAARSELLPVGAGLHGGAIAAALADARARSVRLRRHLAGIAD